MDLLDFGGEDMYFDTPVSPEVDALISGAAEQYGAPEAELSLLRAYFLQPEHFTVLVAMYRYFYYQHRFEDALRVADRILVISAGQLGMNCDWQKVNDVDLACGVQRSMGLLRFYLHALKGAGYLNLRLGQYEDALHRLQKVVDLDASDRIGAVALRDMAMQALRDKADEAVTA